MLHLVELMVQRDIRPDNDLLLLLNADEEHHNTGMRAFLEAPPKIDFAVVGEPTGLEIHLGHRGVMAFDVRFSGRSAHAARPEEGVNAVEQAVAFCQGLQALNRALSEKPDPLLGAASIKVTMISGGTKVNVIPESCVLSIDRRLIAGETPEEALRQVESLAAPFPGAEVKITTCCPPGSISRDNRDLGLLAEGVRTALDKEPVYGVFPATCEAGLLTQKTGVPSVIFGPGSIAQAHQTDEFISLEQLSQGARCDLAMFANLLFDR